MNGKRIHEKPLRMMRFTMGKGFDERRKRVNALGEGIHSQKEPKYMLLMEVEKQVKTLSQSDKMRLIQDVQRWLEEETRLSGQSLYPALTVPEIAQDFPTWKYDVDEMAKVAKTLNTYKATLTRPAEFDESQMTMIDV